VSPEASETAEIGFSLAPLPTLQITSVGLGECRISWPAAAAGYTLERTTQLAPPAAWTPVTNPVESVGGTNRITITSTESAAYYRLKQ
jgi:hypothetical protein